MDRQVVQYRECLQRFHYGNKIKTKED